MIALRDYQRQAIDAVISYWEKGGGNPLVSMATGTGKSVVIAELVKELHQINPDIRFVMLTHVRELVQQNARALLRHYPQANFGINSAGLGRRDMRSKILFASIQSIFRETANTIGPRDIVLIDECHLTPKSGDGMYRQFLAAMREGNPELRVAGFTATPYRMDSGRLDKGPDRLFDEIVFEYTIRQGIEDKFLSPLVSKATIQKLDVSGVAKRGGEFVSGALEVAVDKEWITREAVSEIVQYGQDRRSWLIFCAGVKHAEHVRDEVRSRGISCEMVTGETPTGERDRILKDFQEGRLRCLTNMSVLTTGFDAPGVDLIAMLRPTLSAGLYVQCIGRGTRLAPSKSNCMVLDFAGNIRRHGPVDAVTVGERSSGKDDDGKAKEGDVRAKECPACKELLALNVRTCTFCGHEFPASEEPKHEARAADDVPITTIEGPAWRSVSDLKAHIHTKPGAASTLRIEYLCGAMIFREWLCFDHPPGFAHDKAVKWWRRFGQGSPPGSVLEAFERSDEITGPDEIQVRYDGKYWSVIAHRRVERRAA